MLAFVSRTKQGGEFQAFRGCGVTLGGEISRMYLGVLTVLRLCWQVWLTQQSFCGGSNITSSSDVSA